MTNGTTEVVDLRKSDVSGTNEPTLERADQYSEKWAREVRPIAWSLLTLLATVMLLPFAFVYGLTPSQVKIVLPAGTPPEQASIALRAAAEALTAKRLESMLDWAKTVLPSVVGFGSAMVGYYFGTRAAQESSRERNQQSPPQPPARQESEPQPSAA